jgi:radical SAM protein with 4Fe4S-binding SPASM domain
VPQGRGELMKGATLTRLRSIQLGDMVMQLRAEGYELRLGSPWNYLLLGEETRCMAGTDRLVIGPTLQAFPCDAFKRTTLRAIVDSDDSWCLKDSDLEEVWLRSPLLELVRAAHESLPSGACQDCVSQSECGCGCMAQRALAGGLGHFPDPGCLRE